MTRFSNNTYNNGYATHPLQQQQQQQQQQQYAGPNSFELKPAMVNTHGMVTKNANNLRWTESRDLLPQQLAQQGVPIKLWQESYDNVINMMQSKIKMRRTAMTCIFIPFVACCVLPCWAFKKQHDIINDWDELLFTEAKKYKSYGIKVSICTEMVNGGVGSDRHLRVEEVGLIFTIVGAPTLVSPAVEQEYQPAYRPESQAHTAVPYYAGQQEPSRYDATPQYYTSNDNNYSKPKRAPYCPPKANNTPTVSSLPVTIM